MPGIASVEMTGVEIAVWIICDGQILAFARDDSLRVNGTLNKGAGPSEITLRYLTG